MFGPLTVRVLYNENRGEWVVGPSDETVKSRTFHNTKKTAKSKARKLAKQHNGVLEVYTRDGDKQLTKDFGELESGSNDRGGSSLSDLFGI